MKLGILTALWSRPALSRLVMDYYASLSIPGIEMVRVAVRSPEDPDPAADHPAWIYAEHSNRILSDKWNAGMDRMREEAPDAVMIVGSDDLVNASYIRRTCDMLEDGPYVVPVNCYFYDTRSGRACYGTFTHVGAGRVLSRSLLYKVEWEPWQPGWGALDGAMDRRMALQGVRPAYVPDLQSFGGVILDVKTDVNKWDYQHIASKGHPEIEPESLLLEHFPEQAPALLGWHSCSA